MNKSESALAELFSQNTCVVKCYVDEEIIDFYMSVFSFGFWNLCPFLPTFINLHPLANHVLSFSIQQESTECYMICCQGTLQY